jgi:hypothetical protein
MNMNIPTAKFTRGSFLPVAGAGLIFIGSLLPWKCHGDIHWYCVSGVEIRTGAVQSIGPGETVMAAILLAAACLIVRAVASNRIVRNDGLWWIVVSGTTAFLVLQRVLIDRGGMAAVFLGGLAAWITVRFSGTSRPANALAASSLAILASIAAYNLAAILVKPAGAGISGEGALQFGLPLVASGACLLWIGFFAKRRNRQLPPEGISQ